MLNMWPCKHVSHIQVLVINFSPMEKRRWERLLIVTTHLDQSNYLVNQNREQLINTIWLCFIDPFRSSSRALESCAFCSGSQQSSSGFTGLGWSTSSKISSAGSHAERWWRCCKWVNKEWIWYEIRVGLGMAFKCNSNRARTCYLNACWEKKKLPTSYSTIALESASFFHFCDVARVTIIP
jgi:hypothetical protein